MTLALYKIVAALLILLVSLATIFYLLRKKSAVGPVEPLQLGEALASGIFLGTALFHLLPDSIYLFSNAYPAMTYPLAEAICAGSFLLMLLLERLSIANTALQTRQAIPYIFALILTIHALTEGAALGIGMTLSEISLLFIAILAHKASESFALCVELFRSRLPYPRIYLISVIFAFMTPAGIFIGSSITASNDSHLLAAWFNAFAAGTFLYISTLHHVHFHEHAEDAQGLLEFAALAIGVCAMGLIALWA